MVANTTTAAYNTIAQRKPILVSEGGKRHDFTGMTMNEAKASKRTRGPGRPILERIEEGADRILLDIVKNGQAVVDVNG